MKCYNHHDRDAFGICKACGKGLCLECLKEDKGVLLCKDNDTCSKILKKCRWGSLIGLLLMIAVIVMLIVD